MVFLGVNVYTTDRSGCKSLRLSFSSAFDDSLQQVIFFSSAISTYMMYNLYRGRSQQSIPLSYCISHKMKLLNFPVLLLHSSQT